MISTPWIGRLAAVLLLVGAILVVALWIVEPLRNTYAKADADLADAKALLARYERVVAQRGALERQLDELKVGGAQADAYLAGETDALAAAALQSRLASLIVSVGGGISSVQVLPSREESGLRRVAIRLQFASTIDPLSRILYELEAGRPVLFIDNLDIQGRAGAGAPQPDATHGEPALAVSFDLYGYMPGGQAADGGQ